MQWLQFDSALIFSDEEFVLMKWKRRVKWAVWVINWTTDSKWSSHRIKYSYFFAVHCAKSLFHPFFFGEIFFIKEDRVRRFPCHRSDNANFQCNGTLQTEHCFSFLSGNYRQESPKLFNLHRDAKLSSISLLEVSVDASRLAKNIA